MANKSNDTKLSDAQAARDAEQAGKVAPADLVSHLREETQDVGAKAAEAGAAPDKVAALEARVAQLVNIVEGLQASALKAGDKATGKADSKIPVPTYPQCHICYQAKSICAELGHTTVNVLPRSPENLEGFEGVTINGQNYFGMCVVAKRQADTIISMARQREQAIVNLRHNSGKMRGLQTAMSAAQLASLPPY